MNSTNAKLSEAWEHYTAFWKKYTAQVPQERIASPLSAEESEALIYAVNNPSNQTLPIMQEFLPLAIHPEDLVWFYDHSNFDAKLAANLAAWQFGLMDSKTKNTLLSHPRLATPIVPAPFYGDPRTSYGWVILNNPGADSFYNVTSDDDLPRLNTALLANQLRYLRLSNGTEPTGTQVEDLGINCSEPDWISVDHSLYTKSWYFDKYRSGDLKKKIFPLAPQGLFQAELVPYCSMKGNARFMRLFAASFAPGDNSLPPSLLSLFDLLKCWLIDRPIVGHAPQQASSGVVFFRKKQAMRQVFSSWIKEEICKDLGEVLFYPSSPSSMSITWNNACNIFGEKSLLDL